MTYLPTDSETAVELRDYWRIFRRRRRIIVMATLAGLSASLAYVFVSQRIYESSARVLIEDGSRTYTRSDPSQPFGDVLSLPGHDVLTQMEVLRSDDLLQQALRKAHVPRGTVKTNVTRVYDTDVVSVAVQSLTPAYAERTADMLPRVFIAYGAAINQQEVAGAARFARSRLVMENQQLAAAALALQKFRDREGITDLAEQRTTGITAARAAAADVRGLQQDVEGLSAQLASLRAYRSALPAVSSSPKTVTNPNIASLKERIAAQENDRARLIVLYKPNHTRVQELDAQIHSLRRQLKAEPPTITTVTKTPNAVASESDRQIADLGAALAAKRNELVAARSARRALDQDLTRYAALTRRESTLQQQVDQHQAASAMLATNVDILGIREKASHAPASLVSGAGPARLVAPRISSALAAGMLGGLLLGLVAALLTEHLDERVYTEADARRLFGSPVLGLIPRGVMTPLPGGESTLHESFRVLRANTQFALAEHPPRSMLITSTMAAEGKSFTAVNLAMAMARDGSRVILVDADLRSPSLNERLETNVRPGLADVLLGRSDLKSALHRTEVPGLIALTAGSDPGGAVEALNGAAVEALTHQLRGLCDFTIFDGPPLLGATESLILSAHVDSVLYVVAVGGPPKPMLTLAEQLLSNAHAHVAGVVLNRVDPAMLGYGSYRTPDRYGDKPKDAVTARAPDRTTGSPVSPAALPGEEEL
jgi:capsular exopolysaccharide synthesis family protein